MDEAIVWRDGLINSPVTISYTNELGSQSLTTCFIKQFYSVDKALVVDLSKPKGVETCPYLT